MKILINHTILAASLLVASLTNLATAESNVAPAVVDKLVQPYLEVQASLAADNLPAAKAGAESLLSTLQADPQAESLDKLQSAASSIATSEDIKAARAAFLDLSNGLIALVKTTGSSREPTLYVAHCPMAFSGKGGSWLQADTNVLNPYYGASMLRCGEISERIGKDEIKSHQKHGEGMNHMKHGHGMMDKGGKSLSGTDLDAIHAGVRGYNAQSGSSKGESADTSGCQMACCQKKS